LRVQARWFNQSSNRSFSDRATATRRGVLFDP
jgi:hypothetical protein